MFEDYQPHEESLYRDDLRREIDRICDQVLEDCHGDADAWDEDYVTLRLLNELNALNGKLLRLTADREVRLHFDAYKQRGGEETTRGDIAFIIARDDGDYGFFGTAFLEAKKRYDNGGFAALRADQIARIVANEPGSVVGLYDYFDDAYDMSPIPAQDRFGVAILPARQVLCHFDRVSDLRRHATTLGHQFVYRYLEGADMDLAHDAAVATAQARRARFIARIAAGGDRFRDLERHRFELDRYDNVIEVMEQIREREQDLYPEQDRVRDFGFDR